MRIRQLMTLGSLGVFLLAGTAFGQANITTNTTSTTLGSTQFGFAITPAQLGTVMQSTTAPTCGARTAGVMDCTLTNYVKAVGNPGSFTGNPFMTVWTTADFGCGIVCGTNGGADPQTAPNFGGAPGETNTLTGTITSNIDLGLGTATGDAFHSAGHITFTLDPATMAATIDQQIVQEINNAAGLTMVFTETDRTAPGATFTASANPEELQGFAGPVNMTAGMTLTQTGDTGLPSATPFALNVTVPFPYGLAWNNIQFGFTGSQAPNENTFATPGLNVSTGDPNLFPNFF